MRLPIADPEVWRVGHYYRRIPEGYLESLATGSDRLLDPGFGSFFEAMQLVVRGPLWSGKRWRAIWSIWSGRYSAAIAAFAAGDYRHPPRVTTTLDRLSAPLPKSASNSGAVYWWDAPASICIGSGGIAIELPKPSSAADITLYLNAYEELTVTFRSGDQSVGSISLGPGGEPDTALAPRHLEVPAGTPPFDTIWIDGVNRVTAPANTAIARIELDA